MDAVCLLVVCAGASNVCPCVFFSVRMCTPDDYARCVNDCSHGNQLSVLSERCGGVRAGRGEREREREEEESEEGVDW